MTESLFSVALSQARRKIISWPPPSYLQNGKEDSECRSPNKLIFVEHTIYNSLCQQI